MPSLPDAFASFRLDGRTALVTGARREIGRAIALGLAAQGARVAVHHLGNAEETHDADQVVAEIRAGGGNAQAFAADFAAEGGAESLGAAVLAAFGRVDILVFNASIEILERWDRVTRATFERQIQVNLWATLALAQVCAPGMVERRWGRILTIGSIQQLQPHAQMMVYAGTKAAQRDGEQPRARRDRDRAQPRPAGGRGRAPRRARATGAHRYPAGYRRRGDAAVLGCRRLHPRRESAGRWRPRDLLTARVLERARAA